MYYMLRQAAFYRVTKPSFIFHETSIFSLIKTAESQLLVISRQTNVLIHHCRGNECILLFKFIINFLHDKNVFSCHLKNNLLHSVKKGGRAREQEKVIERNKSPR